MDTDYNFRRVDVGTDVFCYEARTLNENQLRDKVEVGCIGFPEASHIEKDGPDKTWGMICLPQETSYRSRQDCQL